MPPVTIVDRLESVNNFGNEISQLLLFLATMKEASNDGDLPGNEDEQIPGMDNIALVGIDCEWNAKDGTSHKTTILQISFPSLDEKLGEETVVLYLTSMDADEPCKKERFSDAVK